jgi:hypothetical protein
LTAGGAAALVGLAFLGQQLLLWHWQSKWDAMAGRVNELQSLQQQVRRYRPWFDESFRSLTILRRLTEAFPEDGAVSARVVAIREPSRVTCSGTARENQAWLGTLDRLRATREIGDLKVEQISGRTPIEFTLNFQWKEPAGP